MTARRTIRSRQWLVRTGDIIRGTADDNMPLLHVGAVRADGMMLTDAATKREWWEPRRAGDYRMHWELVQRRGRDVGERVYVY